MAESDVNEESTSKTTTSDNDFNFQFTPSILPSITSSIKQVFTSNTGALLLCDEFFKQLNSLYPGFDFQFTSYELAYSLSMAYLNRIIRVYSYHVRPVYNMDYLHSHVGQLAFPSSMAEYIQSFGRVRVGSETIIPWLGSSLLSLFPVGYEYNVSPRALLESLGRPVPHLNDFWLDVDLIVKHIHFSLKLIEKGLVLKRIDYSTSHGDDAMMVSFGMSRREVTPYSPESLPLATAVKGAALAYRPDDSSLWLGPNRDAIPKVFTYPRATYDVIISELCARSFQH